MTFLTANYEKIILKSGNIYNYNKLILKIRSDDIESLRPNILKKYIKVNP